jgi:hypothetical protein
MQFSEKIILYKKREQQINGIVHVLSGKTKMFFKLSRELIKALNFAFHFPDKKNLNNTSVVKQNAMALQLCY